MQIEIIHCTGTQDTVSRESFTDAVHERATRRTEAVRHSLAGGNSFRLFELCKDFFASYVFEVRVCDNEIGGEHRRGDFAAVCTMTNERVD